MSVNKIINDDKYKNLTLREKYEVLQLVLIDVVHREELEKHKIDDKNDTRRKR